MTGDDRARKASSGGEPTADPEQILQGIEDRVRKVRHLEDFDYSVREDGRFRFRLQCPPEEMSEESRETVARLLTRLAEKLRSC